MTNYQVLFNGELVESASIEVVRDNLARELGLDERKAKQLFSGRTIVVRSQLEQHEAQAWQDRFAQLGAICRIKSESPVDRPTDLADGPEKSLFNQEKSPVGQEKSLFGQDRTLREITAARLECPRCGYRQLEAAQCVRCGINIEADVRRKRKEDLIIEKKLKALRAERAVRASSTRPPPAPAEPRVGLGRSNVHDIHPPGSGSKKGLLNWLKRR